MATINTVAVSGNCTFLYSPGPQGAGLTLAPTGIQIYNLDTANTVWVGNSQQVSYGSYGVPMGPLASLTFDGTAPIYAVAEQGYTVLVGVVPGGTSYAPGSLTINGPVTAEITGPVEVEGSVSISSGSVDATISGTPTVELTGTADVSITNSTIDVIGSGGYIIPGQNASLYTNSGAITIPPPSTTPQYFYLGSVQTYNTVDISLGTYNTDQAVTGSALVCGVILEWFADSAYTMFMGIDGATIMVADSQANQSLAYISCPARGAYFALKLTNYGASGTADINIDANKLNVWGSQRTISELQVTQYAPIFNYQTYSLIQNPGGQTTPDYVYNGVLAEINNFSMTASTHYYYPLGIKTGGPGSSMDITIDMSVASSNGLAISPLPEQYGTSPGAYVYQIPSLTASTAYSTTLRSPRVPMFLTFLSPSTAGTLNLYIQTDA